MSTQLSEKPNTASVKSEYKNPCLEVLANPPKPIMVDKAEGISTAHPSSRPDALEIQGHSVDM